jgi:glycosyltransferase involved in cell wall biosynthesis
MKITVLSTFPVYPKRQGGQLRIFHLCHCLSSIYDVTIVSQNHSSDYMEKQMGNLKEISVPLSTESKKQITQWQKGIDVSIADIVMPRLSHLTPEYNQVADAMMDQSDVLIASHPYLFHLMEKYRGRKKLIYDSHNVEYELKKSVLPEGRWPESLLEDVKRVESSACRKSDIIFACSENDKAQLSELYSVDRQKIQIIPNGVDLLANPYRDMASRKSYKAKLGLEGKSMIVFIGSWHKPNQEAVEETIGFAEKLPNTLFLLMGSISITYQQRKGPSNMIFTGVVDEELKQTIYSVADLAINPMIHGSGSNLKMAEYMACGLPVISTQVGARGYNVRDGVHVLLREAADFPASIYELKNNPILQQRLSENGRSHIERRFSWDHIARNIQLDLN